MKTLENTVLSGVYAIFRASSDNDIINTLSIGMFLGALGSVILHFIAPVRYGKTAATTKQSNYIWNYPVSSKFAWRYGFIPTVIVPVLMLYLTPCTKLWNFCNFAGLAIYTTHYFNRSIIYPSKISKNAQPQTLWFLVSMVFVTTVHTFLETHHLLNVHSVDTSYLTYIGIMTSIAGAFINSHHDTLLTNLRKDTSVGNSKPKSKSETKGSNYKIPRGGLFEYVSCANYFGELMEWWGLVMVTKGAPQIAFALFSTVFLGLRALFAHKFYKETFGSAYPSNRKAIIPFII